MTKMRGWGCGQGEIQWREWRHVLITLRRRRIWRAEAARRTGASSDSVRLSTSDAELAKEGRASECGYARMVSEAKDELRKEARSWRKKRVGMRSSIALYGNVSRRAAVKQEDCSLVPRLPFEAMPDVAEHSGRKLKRKQVFQQVPTITCRTSWDNGSKFNMTNNNNTSNIQIWWVRKNCTLFRIAFSASPLSRTFPRSPSGSMPSKP